MSDVEVRRTDDDPLENLLATALSEALRQLGGRLHLPAELMKQDATGGFMAEVNDDGSVTLIVATEDEALAMRERDEAGPPQ